MFPYDVHLGPDKEASQVQNVGSLIKYTTQTDSKRIHTILSLPKSQENDQKYN